MTFDPSKPVRTRSGRKATICPFPGRRPNPRFPLFAYVENGKGRRDAKTFTVNGISRRGSPASDLVNVEEAFNPLALVWDQNGRPATVFSVQPPPSRYPVRAMATGRDGRPTTLDFDPAGICRTDPAVRLFNHPPR